MIYLASDHAGFELKEKVKEFLQKENIQAQDLGAFELNKDDDFPTFISKAAEGVAKDPENSKAIIFGGSGQAESMLANKFKGVRAALFYSAVAPREAADVTGRKSDDPFEIVKLTREHNNANVLSIGARFVSAEEATIATKLWLETPFLGAERHARRINEMKEIEDRIN